MNAMTENHDSSARRSAKRSERTCAGCGNAAPIEELVRVILDPSTGEVAVDLANSGFGRGAHLHAAPDCVTKSLKGGLARVFKTKVVADASAIGADIVSAADRRIEGLLIGARRAGQLAVGSDVVTEAMRDGRADLVVVARDARAATRLPEIERAIAAGKAIALGDKQHLGLLMGGNARRDGEGARAPGEQPEVRSQAGRLEAVAVREVAVIAILHAGVADAVSRAYRMSGPFRGMRSDSRVLAVDRVAESSDAHVESTDRSEEAWSSSPEVR
jgi:predicted RNA-binding protein YlxR (DUF448 family)/ribosomal protein L7Ae-like RNA K-turn-binding protein